MILTSNYAARRFGVRSAMPGYIGEALVRILSRGERRLIYCPSNFELYREKSQEMRRVLSRFDPNQNAYSLDEVYMDLGPYLACSLTHPEWSHEQIAAALTQQQQQQGKGKTTTENDERENGKDAEAGEGENDALPHEETLDSAESLQVLLSFPPAHCIARVDAIVADMRERVRSATGGLTCSAGVAPNFLLAKIASDRNKPNGQLIVSSEHEKVTEFLHPLPIRKVSGIGRVTEKILNAFEIATVEQLYKERALVRFLFEDSSTSAFLLRASVGCSSSDGKVSEDDSSSSHQKGISRERTMQPGKSWAEINSKFEDIGQLLSQDMERKGLWAQTVTVKVKLSTFDCLSRARKLPRGVFVQSAEDLLKVATELLVEIRQKEMASNNKGTSMGRALFSVRLLGIRCSNLVSDDERRSEAANQMKIDRFFQQSQPNTVDDGGPEEAGASDRAPPSKRLEGKMPQGNSGEIVNPYSPQRPTTEKAEPPRVAGTSFDDESQLAKDDRGDAATSTTANPAESPPMQSMECPVCGVQMSAQDNDALNRHLDACLNGTMVRQAVREESARRAPQQRKKAASRSLTDFFLPDTNKAASSR